jgi:hypothetical protein
MDTENCLEHVSWDIVSDRDEGKQIGDDSVEAMSEARMSAESLTFSSMSGTTTAGSEPISRVG